MSGTREAQEKFERGGNSWLVKQSEHMQHLKFTILYGRVCVSKWTTIVTSKPPDQQSLHNYDNKEFETSQELLKWDTETRSQQTLLGKGASRLPQLRVAANLQSVAATKRAVCANRGQANTPVLCQMWAREPRVAGGPSPALALWPLRAGRGPTPDCPGISTPKVANPARPLLINLEF